MDKVHMLLLIIFCVTFKNSHECSMPSFVNTLVNVNENVLTINGCISSNTLNHEGQLNLSVSDQKVPDLNRGAVRDIINKLRILFNRDNIEIIREEAFLNLPGVTLIDLSDNKISWIAESAFNNLPSLTKINLNTNAISVLPRAFSNLPKLEEVDFANNDLESFDQVWFYRTPALRWIFYRDNRLRSIPKAAFINLPSIVQLHFENNLIEHIDKDAFKGLRNLQRVYFAQNKLKSFDINFHEPSQLVYMGVQFNNITYLSDRMLDVIKPKLLKFWITSNPWQCACFDKLIKWGIDNNIEIAFMCQQMESVCVYPKINSMECIQRTDDDFYREFSKTFGSEWTCTPGADY